ncbi:MAG: hypothetical protein U0Q11_17620 [Vicinamibacterales bacterium]
MRLTHLLACAVIALAIVLASPARTYAQMPIQGVTGTMVPPSTAEAERKAEDAAAAGAGSGLHRLGTAFKTLFGIKPTHGVLDQLLPGTTVVVRTPATRRPNADADLDETTRVTEGSVISVDKRRQSVVVKFATGDTTTYVLQERSKPSTNAPAPDAASVSLSYTDKTGQRVTHEFSET